MKKIAIILLVVLSSCYKDAKESFTTDNDFKIEFLFEVDGCRVYRFKDGGYVRYVTTCPDSKVEWTETVGKSHKSMEIPTVKSPK